MTSKSRRTRSDIPPARRGDRAPRPPTLSVRAAVRNRADFLMASSRNHSFERNDSASSSVDDASDRTTDRRAEHAITQQSP